LVQHGDPRWTFIRVQCELAKADRDDPRRPELEARNRALQAEYNASLRRACRAPSFLGDHLTNLEYSRGFPERLSLYQNSLIHDFLRRKVADRFFRFVGPVRRIYLGPEDVETLEAFCQIPHLAYVEELTLLSYGPRYFQVLAASPHLRRLCSLRVEYIGALEPEDARSLLESPHLARLTKIDVAGRGPYREYAWK